MVTVIGCQQARQILEREYNNLLALGTERRLDEVSPCLSLKRGLSASKMAFKDHCSSVPDACIDGI